MILLLWYQQVHLGVKHLNPRVLFDIVFLVFYAVSWAPTWIQHFGVPLFLQTVYGIISHRNKEFHGYTSGQLVYLFFPGHSLLHTGNRKFTCKFVGPLAIWKGFSPTQFVLMSLDGVLYPYLIEATRLKPAVVRTTKGNVYTLSAMRQVIKGGYVLQDTGPDQRRSLSIQN